MIQGISGKCPQCGQTDIIVTRIDGMNYEGYCAACEDRLRFFRFNARI